MDRYANNNFEILLGMLNEQKGDYDREKIEKAFYYCVEKHDGQKRLSGEPYYMHPYNVACILIKLGMDTDSIVAALLHDVVEDTDSTLDEVKKEFGEDVATIVDGVTKLGKIPLSSKDEIFNENVRKMMIAMTRDIRVIIIKLADRLHNMRTLEAQSREKQLQKSLETLEVFAPIAHRLGINNIKEELEDIAISYLDPVGYRRIELMLTERDNYNDFLGGVCEKIDEHLKGNIVDYSITSRVKSKYGIYKKMYMKGKEFEEIYDVYAVRIITDTVADCYHILGLIYDLYRPIPKRFKNYIATPKPNMYQSIHTTVLGREGIPFEVQIRTWDMHHTAEFGIAAHWKYKEGINKNDAKFEERLAWIRQILESQRDGSSDENIVQTIKNDLSAEQIYAVTPKGDVITLPAGSTVIDFAYAIHSGVGNSMVGAKADGKMVTIDHEIQIGEIIEILTTRQPDHGPSRDWLNIAKTNSAKSKIRSWFKNEKREENIEKGREDLERAFRKNKLTALDEDSGRELIEAVAKSFKFVSIDDFYAAIGYGGITISKVIERCKEQYAKYKKNKEKEIITAEDVETTPSKANSNGITIEGMDNCRIKISRCCNPLPGEDIIGFITRGYGVSIHRRNCKNVPADIENSEEPGRWVKAGWGKVKSRGFKSHLHIDCIDRSSLLADVSYMLASMHVPLHSCTAREHGVGGCIIDVVISTEGVEHLAKIIASLKKIKGVLEINRDID